MKQSIAELESAAIEPDWKWIADADLSFHQVLVGSLDIRRIERIYRDLRTELRLAMMVGSSLERENPSRVATEHEEVLVAIMDGRLDRATEVLACHLEYAESHMVALITAGKA